METLYHTTNRLVQETQQCFQKLENRLNNGNIEGIEHEIQARIDAITSNCEKLDILVHKEPVSRRQNAKMRIDQLKYDNHHFQAALRVHQHEAYRKKREESEREELLSRRFTHNNYDTSPKDTTIFIDHSLQHKMSLQNANNDMENLLRHGTDILGNLRDQRNTLKNTRKRILDIASTLGLSNTTMRLIERRVFEDRFIMFGGMAITCLIIVIVIIYLT